jgi:hypothetical protein
MDLFKEVAFKVSQSLKDFEKHKISTSGEEVILKFLFAEKEIQCITTQKELKKFRFIVSNSLDYTEIPLKCKDGKVILTYLPPFRKWVVVAFLNQ